MRGFKETVCVHAVLSPENICACVCLCVNHVYVWRIREVWNRLVNYRHLSAKHGDWSQVDELEECAGLHSARCSAGGGLTADVRPCACAHSLHVASLQKTSVSSGGTVANLQHFF